MAKIKIIYGIEWCGDCKRSKKFLLENNVPFEWIDVDDNEDAADIVRRLNGGKRPVPTIVFDGHTILVEPSNEQLAVKLGINYD
ncbi:MAG: pyridine nucleotide-disulfide oxidoreductase, partial [Candidatus Heimdallarchaeota archaeon]|nr:pyridine nucleotide-disulfide oxidoreductase [Candidatus Heimdallarchaeota archaeon]